jgi:hypothetical protein
MKAMSLSARARRDGLDLDELYPTTGYEGHGIKSNVAGWIERGEDPPIEAEASSATAASLARNAKRPRTCLTGHGAASANSAWERAWMATQALFFCVGAVALVAAMAALPPLVIAGGTVALGVAWFALYKLIERLEARK